MTSNPKGEGAGGDVLSHLLHQTWDEIREFVSKEDRPYCLKVFIEALQEADWDGVQEIKAKWPESKMALVLSENDEEE